MNMSLEEWMSLFGMLSDNDIGRIVGGKLKSVRLYYHVRRCNYALMLSPLLVWIRLDFVTMDFSSAFSLSLSIWIVFTNIRLSVNVMILSPALKKTEKNTAHTNWNGREKSHPLGRFHNTREKMSKPEEFVVAQAITTTATSAVHGY